MDREALIRKINELKLELREREKSLPAHSIRPHQLLAIEELEERIAALIEKVKVLEGNLPDRGKA